MVKVKVEKDSHSLAEEDETRPPPSATPSVLLLKRKREEPTAITTTTTTTGDEEGSASYLVENGVRRSVRIKVNHHQEQTKREVSSTAGGLLPKIEPKTEEEEEEDDEEIRERRKQLHARLATLSVGQRKALDLILKGASCFVTGGAGVGKSTLMELAISMLRDIQDKNVEVLASTGIAAVPLSGNTMHSHLSMGICKESLVYLKKRMSRPEMEAVRQRITAVGVYVFEEASMITPDFFFKFDHLVREATGHPHLPFGGKQVIIVGDFFQLPPVNKYDSDHVLSVPANATFILETRSWWDLKPVAVLLDEVFRQSEAEFVDMLNRMRFGAPTVADMRLLARRCHPKAKAGTSWHSDGILPTKLYALNKAVAAYNKQQLAAIKEPEARYRYETFMSYPNGDRTMTPARWKYRARVLKNYLMHSQAIPDLRIKEGAQVMLVANLDTACGLVNGSRGVVVGFTEPPPPEVKLEAEERRKKIAAARVGGLVDPKALVRVDDSLYNEEHGAVYGGGEGAKRPTVTAIVDPKAPPVADGLDELPCPIVRFANGVEMAIRPHFWRTGSRQLAMDVVYKQVPLKLAWAMSIHKGQGMSLDKLETHIDDSVFEYGQAYVAISRARSMDGLLLPVCDREAFAAHPKALWFHKTGYSTRMPPEVAANLEAEVQDRVELLDRRRVLRQTGKTMQQRKAAATAAMVIKPVIVQPTTLRQQIPTQQQQRQPLSHLPHYAKPTTTTPTKPYPPSPAAANRTTTFALRMPPPPPGRPNSNMSVATPPKPVPHKASTALTEKKTTTVSSSLSSNGRPAMVAKRPLVRVASSAFPRK
jgi:ATP-dependent DNA helicase PIF1